MGDARGHGTADGPSAAAADDAAGQRAEVERQRALVDDLRQELEDTNRGLIALHTELENARRAEARLAAVVASSDDAMITVDTEHRVQIWNPGAERLLGHARREVTGQPIDVLMPKDARDAFRTAVEEIGAGGHARPHQTRWRRADGTDVDVAVTVSAMRDPDGALVGFCTVARDITHQLAAQAELDAARTEREVTAERDRIARDLHDMVIQRVFAAGLTLQSLTARIAAPETAARVHGVIDELDATIRELRSTIFALHQPAQKATSLRAQVLAETATAQRGLGFAPVVEFAGPVDAALPDETAAHLLAALREALSNATRHAHATAVTVTVRADRELLLEVTDNGRGLGTPTRSSGLRNLSRRAEQLGGSFEAATRPEGGTRVCWRIPLVAAPSASPHR